MKTILLKLAGPLQSWGTGSSFDTRWTDRYPSKSAIIGMIAAAFGYRRDNDESIRELNKLSFAVRVDQQGTLLKDYHIAKRIKPNGDIKQPYVTNRYYLQDAVFIVAIGSDNDALIEAVHEALRNPKFQLFLGRRALPVTADFIVKITNNNVLASLTTEKWHAASWYQKKHKNVEEIDVYADAHLVSDDTAWNGMSRDYVESFSERGRMYSFRPIKNVRVSLQNKDFEHDILGYLGGD